MASPIFGCIVPGRLVQFDCTQVSENQVVFTLPDCEKINHLVVFLTGTQPFPDGFGGSVYLCWPKPEPSWHLLGFLSNDKPSVIFKVAKPKASGIENPFASFQAEDHAMAQIGIAVEPAMEILQKAPVVSSDVSMHSNFVQFTQKMLESLVNFCSSFAVTPSQINPGLGSTFVPTVTIQKWYEQFERKFSLDPNFWKS